MITESVMKGLKLTIETQNDVVLVFLLLIFNIFHTFFSVSIVDFKQKNVSWVTVISPQQMITTSSKSTIETLAKLVEHVQS